MGTKRKQHSAQFKAEVAIAALSGSKTLAELSSEYGVHPTMISSWKQELVKNAKELFERGRKKGGRSAEGYRPIAPQDWPVAGRSGFLGRAARHCSPAQRRAMITPGSELPIARQAKLLGVSRSSVYYRPRPESQEELDLLKRLDELFTEHPMYGSRRLQQMLKRDGIPVGRRRIRTLMKKLGLRAVGPKPNTSQPHPEHKVYPYLLRGLMVDRPNQVWASDITYIRMRHGFLYLCVIMDWATRKVLAWRLSNTLTSDFCTAALKEALARYGRPEIFNTDQGSQFTSAEFTGVLKEHRIQISMDGRGRCHDNIFVERLWWTVKHEWVYLRPCDTGIEQQESLAQCFEWYNRRRPHQSLDWQTPDEAYFGALAKAQVLAA